jgi:hypothetical protein
MTQYQRRFRVKSSRLPHWDYTRAGWYFVTLRAYRGAEVFGRIADGTVHLSAIGRIVGEEWQRTPSMRPNVELDEWILMPNHLHGIVAIREDGTASARPDTETPRWGVSPPTNTATDEGEAGHRCSVQSRCSVRSRVSSTLLRACSRLYAGPEDGGDGPPGRRYRGTRFLNASPGHALR